jgi:hypothetical protein
VGPNQAVALGPSQAGELNKAPTDLNVADFDVVILNFAAFEDRVLAEGLPLDRLPDRRIMARAVFAPETEVIAIGDPSTPIGVSPQTGSLHDLYEAQRRSDYWLPCWIGVEPNAGVAYDVLSEEWQFFFEHVRSWSWIATGETGPAYQDMRTYLEPVARDATHVFVAPEALAQTRSGSAIGLVIRIAAVKVYRHNPAWSPVATAGGIAEAQDVVAVASPVFWLPSPDQLSIAEAIDLILRQRFGLQQKARTPDWARWYRLPAEVSLLAEIAKLESERHELEYRILDARQRAAEAAAPTGLLYEKGKEVLEPVVRTTLRTLGARVEEPAHAGIEDGLVFYGDHAAVLEVKGARGQVTQDNVRQVVQWATDARLRDGVAYKALIVGNPFCEMPLHERGAPLAPNATQYAENGDVGLVTTAQLYEALRRHQNEDFDQPVFWQTVFAARGVAALPKPPEVSAEPA